MARLIARINTDGGRRWRHQHPSAYGTCTKDQTHRLGNRYVETEVADWDFAIDARLNDDHTCQVEVRDLTTGKTISILSGNLESLCRRTAPKRTATGRILAEKAKIQKRQVGHTRLTDEEKQLRRLYRLLDRGA